MDLNELITEIPDFPRKGVLFKDISPLLLSPRGWQQALNELGDFLQPLNVDLIAGVESRGFLIGIGLSTINNIGFIPIRKKGKLPGNVLSIDYQLEYGIDTLEIKSDLFINSPRILLVDDLLATGGTARASCDLIRKAGGNIVGIGFIIELCSLKGRSHLPDIPIRSLISYS